MFKIFSTIDFFMLDSKNVTSYILLSEIFKDHQKFHLSNAKEYARYKKSVEKYSFLQFKQRNKMTVNDDQYDSFSLFKNLDFKMAWVKELSIHFLGFLYNRHLLIPLILILIFMIIRHSYFLYILYLLVIAVELKTNYYPQKSLEQVIRNKRFLEQKFMT